MIIIINIMSIRPIQIGYFVRQNGCLVVTSGRIASSSKRFWDHAGILCYCGRCCTCCGITWRIIVPVAIKLAGVGGGALALVATTTGRTILEHLGFASYQFSRIDTWLNPASNTSDQGYQLWQSMKAIGSGGIFGTGFNVSKVYVPVRESDMIFSVIGENYGFIGSLILILLYFMLIYQMIRVTFDTKTCFTPIFPLVLL